MRLEISKLSKVRDVLQNKLRTAEEQKVDAEHEKSMLKNQIIRLEKGGSLRDRWICFLSINISQYVGL